LELPAHLEPDAAWRQVRAELQRVVGESTFEIWLAPVRLRSWEGDVLLLDAPLTTRSWISERFGHVLERCATATVGAPVRILFLGDGAAAGGAQELAPNEALGAPLHPRYSFDQFVIGDSNRLAHAAALAVAELPGQAYNPLFLHAPPGLGKTHLLHAIGNYIHAFGAGTSVRYATVEAFTNQFIAALGAKSVERFKRAYRDPDVLLIDDVQFLASKAKTEEEFFHTFNSLYESGRQLVLTCDRLPRQLVMVQERLRERFEAGLVADIRPPDFATRLTILRKRVAMDRIPIADPAVLDLIAERITDNVRALEGALIRVVAHHSLTREPIRRELAERVLDQIRPAPAKSSPTISMIQSSVAAYYDIAVVDLVSTSRAARIAWPRQVAIHLARALTDAPLAAIGKAFGGRSHATVLHACRRVAERSGIDSTIAHQLDELARTVELAGPDRDD
jgi:chromosomal replication initiator protein